MTKELLDRLGYQFNDPHLLKIALTHRSHSEENNERLEFLGDSIVNFITAEALYNHYPHAQEGDLSRWRATLVNRDTLGDMARYFNLGQYMFLGAGELKTGGGERSSILSCAIEAIIGAIYLDGGFDIIKERITSWYQPLINSLASASSLKDPKTMLQEYLQSRHMALPVYTVASVEGEAHQQVFVVHCAVEGITNNQVGRGTSRRRAEQEAASAMLKEIGK